MTSAPQPPSRQHNFARGLAFFLATMAVFAAQDGISKLLAHDYPPVFIVMIRYWAFAAFVLAVSQTRPGGIRRVSKSARPLVQGIRGVMLVAQICLMTFSFVHLGLAESHAIFAVYPLLIAAMGAFFLGERVRLAQWLAIAAGFVGVIVLLKPGAGVFDPLALIPLVCAFGFAAYGILTRWVGEFDRPGVSFFWTGVAGAVAISVVGPFAWTSMTGSDWIWMAVLCFTGAFGHWLLIKAYEVAEASGLQPFAYLQLVLASAIGVLFFGETLTLPLLAGSGIIVAAGLFTLLWGRMRDRGPAAS